MTTLIRGNSLWAEVGCKQSNHTLPEYLFFYFCSPQHLNTNIFLFLTFLLVTWVLIHLRGIFLFYTIAQHLPIITRLTPVFEQLGRILLWDLNVLESYYFDVVSFAQNSVVKMPLRGIFFNFILWVHFRACTFFSWFKQWFSHFLFYFVITSSCVFCLPVHLCSWCSVSLLCSCLSTCTSSFLSLGWI